MILPVMLGLSISLSACGKALRRLAASNSSISYGLGMTADGGYSNDDALEGTNSGCNWGVCGTVVLGGVAVILSRSLSSLASCLANEHSNRSKIVRVSRSSSLKTSSPWTLTFWLNCYKKI